MSVLLWPCPDICFYLIPRFISRCLLWNVVECKSFWAVECFLFIKTVGAILCIIGGFFFHLPWFIVYIFLCAACIFTIPANAFCCLLLWPCPDICFYLIPRFISRCLLRGVVQLNAFYLLKQWGLYFVLLGFFLFIYHADLCVGSLYFHFTC